MRDIARANGSTPPPPSKAARMASFPSTAPTAKAACTTREPRAWPRSDGRLALSLGSGKEMVLGRRLRRRQSPAAARLCTHTVRLARRGEDHDQPPPRLRRHVPRVRREPAARRHGRRELHVRGRARGRRERAAADASGRALRRVRHGRAHRHRRRLPRVRVRHPRLPHPLRRALLRPLDAARTTCSPRSGAGRTARSSGGSSS